jgi:hypothetical protein
VVFGFRYLKLTAKFGCRHRDGQYAHKLLERFKALGEMRAVTMRTSHTPSLRCHAIDFAGTSEPDGFPDLPQQLRDSEPWQFEVSSNQHGRVHGFFIGNVFQVVWLDPDHKLYPSR